jgi:hypothetical protein
LNCPSPVPSLPQARTKQAVCAQPFGFFLGFFFLASASLALSTVAKPAAIPTPSRERRDGRAMSEWA